MTILSRKQIEVLKLRAEGAALSEIAENLGKSKTAVEALIRSAQKRLDARNPMHAMALAVAMGEVDVWPRSYHEIVTKLDFQNKLISKLQNSGLEETLRSYILSESGAETLDDLPLEDEIFDIIQYIDEVIEQIKDD